ncbi:uncharacterized protein LOC126832170, partial [Patella vulgata]|uniref:uncharacterized protein LOC126832170 n=1 Tax=Patella vulgata TaxID=6465 RepID=UPI0024A92DCD
IHKKKEIEFYCRDCSVAVCSHCALLDHKNHNNTQLPEIDQEARSKLSNLKGELERKIYELEKHEESLSNQVSDITNQARIACDIVDQQVQKVCDEAKKHGVDVKTKMNEIRDTEAGTLEKLRNDIGKYRASLQTGVKYIEEALRGESTFPVLDILPSAETLTKDSKLTSLDFPLVRYVHYPMVRVDVETLKGLLGELQTLESRTFTCRFSLNEIVMTDKPYHSDVVIIQGLPWCVRVKHRTDKSCLGIYLRMNAVVDKTFKSCNVSLKLTLLNKSEDKFVVKQSTYPFAPDGQGCGWKFVQWNELEDEENGYIDNDKCFAVQAEVQINDIERY